MPLIRTQLVLTPTSQALLILAVCAAAIHFGGNKLKQLALAHPSFQVLQRDPPVQAMLTQTGAINVIQEDGAHSQKSAALKTIPASIPNNLFGMGQKDQSPDSAGQSEAIDYFTQLSNHVRLDAIAQNGAVINGKFIHIGESLDTFAYPAPGENPTAPEKLIAPKLVTVTINTVLLREPISPYRSLTLNQ